MPKRKKGQTRNQYVKECISYVFHKEKKSRAQAVGKCLGMAGAPSKKKKKRK